MSTLDVNNDDAMALRPACPTSAWNEARKWWRAARGHGFTVRASLKGHAAHFRTDHARGGPKHVSVE